MPRIDDRIAAFGLCAVALTAWGPNVFGSQAFILNCIGLAALSFMTRDRIIVAFGCYTAAWCACIQYACCRGWMPAEYIIYAVDGLQLIMSGLAIYVIVRFGTASEAFWINVICALALLLSIIGLLQYHFVRQATATLGCTNFLAAFLAVSAPCFFRGQIKTWKPQPWWGLFIVLPCLFLTNTSTAVLAFCVGAGFWFAGWVGAQLAIVPAVAYFLIFKSTSSLLERVDFWIDAVHRLSAHWYTLLFGVGPGVPWRTDNMLHSEPVYLLWNFGIVGVVIVGFYLYRTFFKGHMGNRIIFTALIVILVDSIGNNILHTAPTAFLTAAIMGLNDRNLPEV